jgi:GNAT superfamily N-acetyltransferase
MQVEPCTPLDFESMLAIINDAATAYRGVIPADCWKEPYMAAEELRQELADGVRFWGCVDDGTLLGVMGLQDVQDVALVRHAYTRPTAQGQGIGTALLGHLMQQTDRRVLVGTWAAASWAIRFYERHGFRRVDDSRKAALLRKYWNIPDRQIETSVVLENPP